MKTYLKIKIMSLAAEAKIIRREEKKWIGRPMHSALWEHRTKDVRREARAALLAYGFLRNRKYRQVEPSGCPSPQIKARAIELAAKYGKEKDRKLIERRISDWLEQPEALAAEAA